MKRPSLPPLPRLTAAMLQRSSEQSALTTKRTGSRGASLSSPPSTSNSHPTTSPPSKAAILLALDPDGPGQKAALANGLFLFDVFEHWGIPRYPSEPTCQALATAQRAYSDLKAEFHRKLDLGEDTEQTEYWMLLTWEYCESLRPNQQETLYTRCQTADEFAAMLAIEENPILPTHGRIDYEAIKNKVDIVDYISRDTELRPSSGKMKGKCPFPDHEDSTASFWVYPSTRSFYCFGCNRGGDVIEYAKLRGTRAGDIK